MDVTGVVTKSRLPANMTSFARLNLKLFRVKTFSTNGTRSKKFIALILRVVSFG